MQCHSHRAPVPFPEHCHVPTRTNRVYVSSYSLTDSPADIRQKSRAQPLPSAKNMDYFSTMPIPSSLSSNSLFNPSTNIISTSLPSARPPIHHILPLSLSKILCTRIRTAGLGCAFAIHVVYDERLVQVHAWEWVSRFSLLISTPFSLISSLGLRRRLISFDLFSLPQHCIVPTWLVQRVFGPV